MPGKIRTYRTDRIGIVPQCKYYINGSVMPKYSKMIIKRLAVRYSGDVLIEKLIELKYCSLKTALEVLYD